MRILTGLFLIGMAAPVSFSSVHAADRSGDEEKIKVEQQGIDGESSGTPDSKKIDALSSEFNVPSSSVEQLRSKGQGWGEISVGLSMAGQLSKTDPTTYPTVGDALQKIEALRSDGMGWGKIANQLGFKLGPVVSAARRARNDLREGKGPSPSEGGKPEKTGKPEHRGMEGMPHPEHPDASTRPERIDHPEHPGR